MRYAAVYNVLAETTFRCLPVSHGEEWNRTGAQGHLSAVLEACGTQSERANPVSSRRGYETPGATSKKSNSKHTETGQDFCEKLTLQC